MAAGATGAERNGAALVVGIGDYLWSDAVAPLRYAAHDARAVSRDLEVICLKCLRKDPKQRYHTAQELADDLARFLSSEPIRARPVGPVERLFNWARWRPERAALIALGVSALIAALGWLVWSAWLAAH